MNSTSVWVLPTLKTISWREDEDCCSWEGVTCDNSTGDIIGLDLSFARLLGNIEPSSSLFSLRHLWSISLAQNDLIGSSIPPEIRVFLQMTYLNLSFSPEISQLSKLVSLDLSYNLLEVQNPTMRMLVKNLTQLEDLDLTNVNMSSVIPISLMNFSSSLISLHLFNCSLRGKFPDYTFKLPNLLQLDLSLNYGLYGMLPESNRSSSLAFLSLRNCSFNEEVLNSIGTLTRLTSLDLSRNNFTGDVNFRTFSTLKNLCFLGIILSGEDCLPWKRLAILILKNNSFEGPLPIPTSRSILVFGLSQNRFNGSIPLSICQLTSLDWLELSQNNLTGVVPPCLGNLTDLWYLNLSNNSLTGPIPLPSYAMNYYSVLNNNFSGEISSLLCNATNLQLLDMSNNGLTGTLPQCLKNVTIQLNFLNLRANGFQGLIPEIFHEGSGMISFDFSRNRFDGPLPRSLSKCKKLEAMDVGSNKIVNSFPDCLGDLPLKILSLRSNKLHGSVSISKETHLLSTICVLDLSKNGFEGNLLNSLIDEMFDMRLGNYLSRDNRYKVGSNADYMVSSFSSIMTAGVYEKFLSVMIDLKGFVTEMEKINSRFASLNLSSNHFGGEIPRNIGLLKSLKGLNFSHNCFTGTIPPSVGNLTILESLDLSSNYVVGGIPRELAQLTSLGALDLS